MNKKLMNKKIVFSTLIVSIFVFTSCLKTVPKDSYYAHNYYQTTGDFLSGHLGVYAMLANDGLYGRSLSMDLDWGSDEMVTYRVLNGRGLSFYNYDATDPTLRNVWAQLYAAIGRANSFLDNAHKLTDSLKFYTAEIQFLRGYFYFLLAQHWGNVPIRDRAATDISITTNIHFQPVDSVFLFAINDMEKAYPQLLPVTDPKITQGRVNQSICAGILARVYLHMAGYCADADKPAQYKQVKGKFFEAQLKNTSAKIFLEKARDWADTVINKNYFSITSVSYDSIFIAQAQDAYFHNKEVIWEVEFYGNRAGAYADYFTAGRVGIINGVFGLPGSGYGFVTPYAIKHYDTMPNGDRRYKRNIPLFQYVAPQQGAFIISVNPSGTGKIAAGTCALGKWRRLDEKLLPQDKNNSPTNFPLLRYADVLLMHAEAVNELATIYGSPSNNNNPITEITAIRTRAGLPYANTLPAVGTFALRDTIRIERMRELLGEGLRRQDLIRWGIYFENLQETINLFDGPIYGVDPGASSLGFMFGRRVLENINNAGNRFKFLLQPIPQQELNLNKSSTAVQHPLWR